MKIGAVLLAGGSGQRFGGDKLAEDLGGKPVWRWSFERLSAHPAIHAVIVVASAATVPRFKRELGPAAEVVMGGDTRQASSLAGLWQAAKIGLDGVLFHDAARPFLSAEVVDRVVSGVRQGQAVAAALPVTDTIKEVSGERIVAHLDRNSLAAMQTPQGAPIQMFLDAISGFQNSVATDDMELLALAGAKTHTVLGDERTFKITTPHDLDRARSMLRAMTRTRTGLGYDIHRFSEDSARELWLGGVKFDGETGLEGHSDADVILHAAVDAILGGIAAGDIGVLFPNTDPANKNRPSADFLTEAVRRMRGQGWELELLDIAVQAERPKIMPRAPQMRARIAEIIGCPPGSVSIKATTQEGLGAVGRGEGIAALAVATLVSR